MNISTFFSLLAFFSAVAIAWFVYEAMPHIEDEHAYLFQAQVFSEGKLTAQAVRNPNAFFVPYVIVSAGKRFGKYTPGFPLALSLGAVVGAPWLVNAVASGLTIFLVCLLAQLLFRETAAIFAAVCALISPLHLQLSGSLHSHSVCATALLAGSYAYLRLRLDSGSLRFALLAGAALGFARITRPYSAFVIALSFAPLLVYDLWHLGTVHVRAVLVCAGAAANTCSFVVRYPVNCCLAYYFAHDLYCFSPSGVLGAR